MKPKETQEIIKRERERQIERKRDEEKRDTEERNKKEGE